MCLVDGEGMGKVERETAEKLVAEYVSFGTIINRLTPLSNQIDDNDARSSVRIGTFNTTRGHS